MCPRLHASPRVRPARSWPSCFSSMYRLPPTSTLFPTRRSSDLTLVFFCHLCDWDRLAATIHESRGVDLGDRWSFYCVLDRKSTRLNSSHMSISYAVFCLKKKKHTPAH